VKPGLTGWAQVMYPYAHTVDDQHKKLMYDLYYIKRAKFIDGFKDHYQNNQHHFIF